ncbi:MAG: DEAD/DEAH box helicase, partial [Planctomycetales bacterium]|nr:DEAD/DEAH box helicase [Planctomycetales bacterium]
MIRQQLPIDFHLPSIVQTLASNNCLILQAPPGTGKTTRVAPALMTEMNAWSVAGEGAGGAVTSELLLIQPRRIAARAAAARIAQELGCRVGEEVGYQVRFDARLGKSTRLICMTPGILLRRLQRDALLERVALVLLDEFHERSLEVDLLLGML